MRANTRQVLRPQRIWYIRLLKFTQPVGGGSMLLTAPLCCFSIRQQPVYFLFCILQMRRQDRNREHALSTVTQGVNCRLRLSWDPLVNALSLCHAG